MKYMNIAKKYGSKLTVLVASVFSSVSAFAAGVGTTLDLPVALTGDTTTDGFFTQLGNTAQHIASEYGWQLMLIVMGIFWLFRNVKKTVNVTAN